MKRICWAILIVLLLVVPGYAESSRPRLAVSNLQTINLPDGYGALLTEVLSYEIGQIQKYQIYNQQAVAGLGKSQRVGETKIKKALGAVNNNSLVLLSSLGITKVVSGRIGKIGDKYVISLALIDTASAYSEKLVLQTCHSEEELIDGLHRACLNLFQVPQITLTRQ